MPAPFAERALALRAGLAFAPLVRGLQHVQRDFRCPRIITVANRGVSWTFSPYDVPEQR
jgi:hypothetical protein